MSVDTVPVPAPTDVSADQAQAVTKPEQQGGATASSDGNVNAITAGGGAASISSPNEGNAAAAQFTVRALVSSKEAGVIIGKAGKNVADLREATGVKAGVSKVVPGVHERVLTVTGTLEGVGKAYSSILQSIAENPSNTQSEQMGASTGDAAVLKLLVVNPLMGSVIGKGGATIQALQAKHSSKIVTVKEMLPNSTERIVSVEGTLAAVDATVQELVKIVSEQDTARLTNQTLFQPGMPGNAGAGGFGVGGGAGNNFGGRAGFGVPRAGNFGNARSNNYNTNNNTSQGQMQGGGNSNGAPRTVSGGAHASNAVPTPSNPDLRTQNISIPADMVGCIIGRGGSKINEIRQKSGAKISIAKDAHDESGERMFTITGPSEALEQALYMLYGQLEGEKEKRIQNQKQEQNQA